jgi:hypothetical protein
MGHVDIAVIFCSLGTSNAKNRTEQKRPPDLCIIKDNYQIISFAAAVCSIPGVVSYAVRPGCFQHGFYRYRLTGYLGLQLPYNTVKI